LQNKEKLSAQSAALDLKFNDPRGGEITGNIKVNRPRIESGKGFSYDQAKVAFGDVDMGYKIKFEKISGSVQKSADKDKFEGHAKFSGANEFIEELAGEVNVSKDGNQKAEYALKGGAFKVNFFGQKFKATNVEYQSDKREFSADDVSGDLSIPSPDPSGTSKVGFTLKKPRYSPGEFSFDEAGITLPEIEPMSGVKFSSTSISVKPKRGAFVYSGNTSLNVNKGPISSAQGKLFFGYSKEKVFFYLQNGSLIGNALGGTDNLVASGITYSHANKNRMTIAQAKLDKVMVFGSEVGFELEEASYDDVKGFDFKKATATISEIGLSEDIKATNIILSVEKKNDKEYKIVSDGNFVAGGTLYGLTLTTSGKIAVTKDGAAPVSAELLNAGIKLTSGDQSFELTNVAYGSGIFSAGSATGNFLLPFTEGGHKLTTAVKDLKIGNGLTFSEATVNPNLSVDFGLASANLTELKLQRTEIGNKVSGTGGISVGGGTILGKPIPQLSGTGVVSHQFKNDKSAGTTEKNLEGVAGKLPAFNLPQDVLPQGLWPLGASISIPVAPGAQAKVYAALGGGVESKDTGLSLTKKDADTYTLGAHTNDLTISIFARVGAGLEVGSPFVASVMVGVEGEGKISAKAKMDFTKDFSISAPAKNLDIPIDDKSSFTYKVDGDIKLVAKLVFEATALFFLSKRWEKKLAERTLGTFEKENGGDWKFEGPTEPIQPTDEELMKDVSSNLPASLKGKSKEQLEELGQQKRLDNTTTQDIIDIYKKTDNTKDNPARLFDYGTLNYKRFDWEKIKSALPVIIEKVEEGDTPEVAIDAPMPVVTAGSEQATEEPSTKEKPGWYDGFKASLTRVGKAVKAEMEYSSALKELGLAMNSKQDLINAYKEAADQIRKNNKGKGETLKHIIRLHLELAAIYLEANNKLKRKVHSSMLGDKTQQRFTHLKRFVGARGLKDAGINFQAKINLATKTYDNVKYFEGLYFSSKQSPQAGQAQKDAET
jgi:hypothetical protein